MAAKVHRPLTVIAFNANGIWRQCYELSKHMKDSHIDVALLSETHLKPHERFCIPNYYFYWTDCFPGRKGIPHNHINLCYMCDTCTWQRQILFIRDKPILSLERMLHEDYDHKGSVAYTHTHTKGGGRKISSREPQEVWFHDEMIGGKLPIVK
jgi:hypothetical protein